MRMQLAARISMLNKSTRVIGVGIEIVNRIECSIKVGQQQVTYELDS